MSLLQTIVMLGLDLWVRFVVWEDFTPIPDVVRVVLRLVRALGAVWLASLQLAIAHPA